MGQYYGLIAALAYYVCFQYSKSFILIKKIENNTIISKLVSLFLKRDYFNLLNEIHLLVTNNEYDDDTISQEQNQQEASKKIYEITIAKALNNFVNYLLTGDKYLLDSAKSLLNDLKEISEIRSEPDVWWVIRLLLLISNGITTASLWNVLSRYLPIEDEITRAYIHSLCFLKQGGVFELFITQRNSLQKVLDYNTGGCIVSIPTSSGKTRIAEIAILDCIIRDKEAKVLFITPFRSLAYEIENSLEEVFEETGIIISHLYGGSLFSRLDEKIIEESNVIVATPEKAKALLRSNKEILSQIKLAIIDEGHLLGGQKRLIVNEMFYEELRLSIINNKGRFLVLSAVLPNSEDLAQWLTGSPDSVFKDTWRPSDERLGVLEWDGNAVSLNWRSTDAERNSFNPNFIIREEQTSSSKKKKPKFIPSNKNQAVAATAYKLSSFGPALIFVGLKASVFKMASEYLEILPKGIDDFEWSNEGSWRAFELACIENYGIDSEWLKYARKGILCHNGDLHTDVRTPLERLMRKEKPLVIIATSTLGQGVNLGISSVIFSTLYQAGDPIDSKDFWNIAGRAGRAFVDHEGKILVSLDTSNRSLPAERRKITKERTRINDYFNKNKLKNADSGLLYVIQTLKYNAKINGLNFELLIQLIAENKPEKINEYYQGADNNLDFIDDSLLALHAINNTHNSSELDWIEPFFTNSLACIQAEKISHSIKQEALSFIKARMKGILLKVGNNKTKWELIIKSGIPLNSDIQVNERIPTIAELLRNYLKTPCSIEDRLQLIKLLEEVLDNINVFADYNRSSRHRDLIREYWIKALPMSQIMPLDNALSIITSHYCFNLSWIFNGISNKLFAQDHFEEAAVIEELAVLIELGLPNLKSVKIYQAGIRSRVSAKEIGDLFDDELWDKSIKSYKKELTNNPKKYQVNLGKEAAEWINLLLKYSKKEITILERIPSFTFAKAYEETNRLIAKKLHGKQYLMSPDCSYISEVSEGSIDFTSVNDTNGVYFDYDNQNKVWKLINLNPNLTFRRIRK